MKCKSCGKEVLDTDNICPNCGFNLEEFRKYQKVILEEDPELPKERKVTLIDNPVITFVLGILCVLIAISIALNTKVVILFVILEVLAVLATFYMSGKTCKVSMKPVKNVGVVMAYVGLAITIFKISYVLLG